MSAERTEEATPKRLADARRKGDVARSRDLVAFAGLAGSYLAATFALPSIVERLRGAIVGSFRAAATVEQVDATRVLDGAGSLLAWASAPLLLGAMLVGATVAYLDAGPVFALGRVLPDPGRLDPAKGAAQLVTQERFVELAKSIVGLGVLIAVATTAVFELLPSLVRLPARSPGLALSLLGVSIERVVVRALAVTAVLAAVDLVLSRRAFRANLRMTRDEVKREHTEADGDPQLKSERERQHRQILEHSVLESVRRADVLVVNPTHLAIALRFDEEGDQDAPEVVAKGEDHLAQRMIQAAREAGVPILRDVPLARSLYELELGDEIPEVLFDAVAAVLRAAWAERDAAGEAPEAP